MKDLGFKWIEHQCFLVESIKILSKKYKNDNNNNINVNNYNIVEGEG